MARGLIRDLVDDLEKLKGVLDLMILQVKRNGPQAVDLKKKQTCVYKNWTVTIERKK